nr:PhnD/SsuA/transferrin family substrate-binding protein [Anaerolineae bacterium]
MFALTDPTGELEEEDAAAIAAAISSRSDLVVEMAVYSSYPESYKAVCLGEASLVVLDALSYIAARSEGCAEGLLIAERDGSTATQGQVVAAANQVFTYFNFRGSAYCRPGADSFYGWILPVLTMRREGIDAFTELDAVVDAGSDEAVLQLIADGECQTGATLVGAEQLIEQATVVDIIEVLPPVPNEAVAVSSRLDNLTRALLQDALEAQSEELAEFFSVDAWIPHDDSLYDELMALFEQVGFDFLSMQE